MKLGMVVGLEYVGFEVTVRVWVFIRRVVEDIKYFKERRDMISVVFQKDQFGCMVENVLEDSKDRGGE